MLDVDEKLVMPAGGFVLQGSIEQIIEDYHASKITRKASVAIGLGQGFNEVGLRKMQTSKIAATKELQNHVISVKD